MEEYNLSPNVDRDYIEVNLDLHDKTSTSDVQNYYVLKQGDHISRVLRCNLTKGGLIPIDLKNSVLTLYIKKADMGLVAIKGTIVDATNGIVDFPLTRQSLAIADKIVCEVVKIGSDASTMSFPLFTLQVEDSIADDDLIESTDEFSLLTDALAQVTDWEGKFNEQYTQTDERFNNKFTEITNQFNTKSTNIDARFDEKFNQITNQFDTKSTDIDNRFNDKFTQISSQFETKYNGLENEYATELSGVKTGLQDLTSVTEQNKTSLEESISSVEEKRVALETKHTEDVASINSAISQVKSSYQTRTDTTLNTTNKTVTGAINELLTASSQFWTNEKCTIKTGTNDTSFRFPNGLQINVMQLYGTWSVTQAWGSVYSSPFIASVNYVETFLTPPRVTINVHGGGTAIMVCQAGSPTTTAPGSFYLWKPVQQTGVKDYIEIISIGRWK